MLEQNILLFSGLIYVLKDSYNLLFFQIYDVPQVKNIKYIRFNNELAFHTNVDHSKWAVAEELPWTCIGDLNRDV